MSLSDCPEDSEHKRRPDDQEAGKIWIIEISWTAKKSKKSQKLLIIEQTKIFFIKLGIRLLRVFFNRFPSFRDLKSANWIVYESNLHLRWTRGLYRPHLFMYHHFDCSCCHVILKNLYIDGMVGWIQNSQRFGYDKVSANTASSFSQCYEKSDGSQDPLRGTPDLPN